jgi:hypothetical protein
LLIILPFAHAIADTVTPGPDFWCFNYDARHPRARGGAAAVRHMMCVEKEMVGGDGIEPPTPSV